MKMLIKKYKRPLMCLLAVWAMVIGTVTVAFAANPQTFTVDGATFELSASHENGTVTITDQGAGTIKIDAKGYFGGGKCDNDRASVSFTLTNKTVHGDAAKTPRKVTFTIDVSQTDSDANTITGTTSGSQTLTDGSVTFTAQTGAGSGSTNTITLKITGVTLEESIVPVSTTVINSTGGTVSVDGTVQTEAEKVYSNPQSHSYKLEATPADGYIFYGWQTATGRFETDKTLTYTAQADSTIWPIFIKPDSAVYNIKNTTFYYGYLDQAINATKQSNGTYSGTIVVHQSGSVYHSDGKTKSFTIPSGVTLLVPFDAAYTVITDMSNEVDTTDIAADHSNSPAKTLFRKLTMPTGTTISVANGGVISVSSRSSQELEGQVGPYGAIHMDYGSNITVLSGGKLYVWGYIQGSGTVTMKNGAYGVENYTAMDFTHNIGEALKIYGGKGGDDMLSIILNNLNGGGAFPIRAYTVCNTEVPMTLEYGSTLQIFYHLWGSAAGSFPGYANFIGSKDGDVFEMKEGCTFTRYYKNGKTVLQVNGDAEYNPIQINFTILGVNINMSSANTSGMPLASGLDLEIAGGTCTMNDAAIFSEGCRMYIAKDATFDTNGNNVYFLGQEDDKGAYAGMGTNVHGQQYTVVDEDAKLDVNGTFIASGGFYTTEGKASIISSEGTGVIEFTGTNESGKTIPMKTGYTETQTIKLTDAWLQNGNGTYTSAADNGIYNYINGFWHKGGHSYDNGTQTADPTCTEPGVMTYTCTVCGHSYTEVIPALGHSHTSSTTKAATCTDTGTMTYTCVCGDSYTEVIPALGHSYTAVVTNPTCTDKGYTTHTCAACGDTYKDSEVPALGHSYSTYNFNSETFYSTAVCNNGCNETDTVYTPVRFAAIQLSAESEVLLKFKFYIADELLATDGAYILVTEAANEVTKVDQVTCYYMTDILKTETDKDRYVLFQGIAAGEMTGSVSVQVFDADGKPLSISVYQDNSVCTTLKRTVVDYTRLALNSGEETMRALSAAMVTFGGYAQAFYGVDAEHPAYAILKQEFPNLAFDEKYHGFDVSAISGETINQVLTINGLVSDDTTSISTETGSSFGIAYDAQKINLDSRVSMTTYFILDEGADINDYTFTLTYTQDGKDGLEMELTAAKEADGRYSVKIVDIPVAYWDYMYKLTITKVDSDEEYVVESSILAWARRCILNSTKEDQVNMAKAMYYYNLAANDYFKK